MSRTDRSDAGRVSDTVIADGVVPGLSSTSGELRAQKGRSVRHELEAAGKSEATRNGFGEGVQDSD